MLDDPNFVETAVGLTLVVGTLGTALVGGGLSMVLFSEGLVPKLGMMYAKHEAAYERDGVSLPVRMYRRFDSGLRTVVETYT